MAKFKFELCTSEAAIRLSRGDFISIFIIAKLSGAVQFSISISAVNKPQWNYIVPHKRDFNYRQVCVREYSTVCMYVRVFLYFFCVFNKKLRYLYYQRF